MEQIFNARSIAIIGVSDRPGNLGMDILQNLINWGYEGNIYGVNPRGGKALDLALYQSVADLPEAVDLGVVIVPARAVPGVVEDCGAKGIKHLVIPTGGFEEFSEEGARLRDALIMKARKHGVRFVGPNCFTVINGHNGLCLPFVPITPDIPLGGVSLIVQSGGVGVDFLIRLKNENTGFAKWVSIGNKTSLDEVDYLEYFGRDTETKVICMYLEDVARGRELVEVARHINKPILAFKTNVEPITGETASSHTAALANDDQILSAAFRQAGIIRVQRLAHLAGFAKVFSLPPLKGNRIALVSPTGGILVLASDQCARRGFVFPQLPNSILEDINKKLRAGVINISNPVDLGDVHDADSRTYILDRIMGSGVVDGIVAVFAASLGSRGEVTTGGVQGTRKNIIPDLGKLIRKHNIPIFLGLLATSDVLSAARHQVDFPIFNDAENAVDAAAVLRDFGMSGGQA
jgi:acetate---CoA ligase (ADP-forming)